MQLRRLALATTTVALPSYSTAFASCAGTSFARHAQHRGQAYLARRSAGSTLVAFSSSFGGGKKKPVERFGGVKGEGRASSRSSRGTPPARKISTVMGLELVPALGGAEAAAAAFAGHLPGVFIGTAAVLWSTVLKVPIAESQSALKPIAGAIGSILTALSTILLGIRVFTVQPDTRYIEAFPTEIAHPLGCTRVAAQGSNKGISVPVFKASVEEVQETARGWLESQPRTRIETETPGYLHAKSLSLIFGFPDSVGVKIFKNALGKTEVWVQSELRVGMNDLDVNLNRTKAFLSFLERKLS